MNELKRRLDAMTSEERQARIEKIRKEIVQRYRMSKQVNPKMKQVLLNELKRRLLAMTPEERAQAKQKMLASKDARRQSPRRKQPIKASRQSPNAVQRPHKYARVKYLMVRLVLPSN